MRCGIGVVELATGRTVATLEFHSGVEEIFAVEAIPGTRNPKLCGPTLEEPTDKEIWIVPSESQSSFPSPPLKSAAVDASSLQRQAVEAHEQGKLQESLRCFRLASQANPNSAQLLTQRGNLYQDLNDPSQAEACYARAIEIRPDFAPTQQNMGVLCAAKNHPIRALHHFELAQNNSPDPINFMLAAKVMPVIYESVEQLQT